MMYKLLGGSYHIPPSLPQSQVWIYCNTLICIEVLVWILSMVELLILSYVNLAVYDKSIT